MQSFTEVFVYVCVLLPVITVRGSSTATNSIKCLTFPSIHPGGFTVQTQEEQKMGNQEKEQLSEQGRAHDSS